jgi:hypothetical protein
MNAWTQVTATYNQSDFQMSLYINGAIAAAGTHTPLGGFTGSFNVGADYLVGDDSGSHFSGQIADVEVWRSRLSPSDVAALATSSSSP